MTKTILRLDASMRHQGSVSRRLTDQTVARLVAAEPDTRVIARDLTGGVPFVDEAWIGATFTPPEQRSPGQVAALAVSDALVAEVQAADTLVIGLPMYNFGMPAAFKAWYDLVARVGVTFRYTATGPVGLLEGKRVIVLVATGGTELGGPLDFVTPHLRVILGFIGLTDVTIIGAAKLLGDPDGAQKAIAAAEADVAALAV